MAGEEADRKRTVSIQAWQERVHMAGWVQEGGGGQEDRIHPAQEEGGVPGCGGLARETRRGWASRRACHVTRAHAIGVMRQARVARARVPEEAEEAQHG